MPVSFESIRAKALERHGEDVLTERMPVSKTAAELRQIPDDRWLSTMTKRVFAAGFVWRVIDAKWTGFEVAFAGFEPSAVLAMGAAGRARLLEDQRIVRNGQKIDATLANAHFVYDVSAQHDGFGAFVADWPDDDIIGLWAELKKRGKRLGGDTGPRFLRQMGKPTFVVTGDVTQALVEAGVVDKKPTSKKALRVVQETFNIWSAQTGLDHSALSVVLASSTGERYAF